MPIDGVYDPAAIAVTASAKANAHTRAVKRTDLFMAPFLRRVASSAPAHGKLVRELYRETRTLVRSADGRAADRRLRLGHRWAHRPPRVPGDDAARGLRLPRRPRPPALRPAGAGRGSRFRDGDRPLSGATRRQARARRLQHGHLGRAASAPGGALGPGRRGHPARGARRGAGDPQSEDRTTGDQGDGRGGTLCRVRRGTRRRRRADRARLSAPGAADRGERSVRRRDDRGGARVRRAAEGGGGRHGHPRLHPLPVDPPGVPARLRARGDARLLGRGDGARGRRNPRTQGDRERGGARRLVPVPHDRRPGSVPRARAAVPAAPDRRGRACRARGPEAGGMSRADGRRPDELRPLILEPSWLEQPHGSVLYSQGKTKVLCTASIEESVPRWLLGKGRGWMTAEYSLLPASTGERTQREASRGRQGGRTVEIQRLIGRALRAVTDFQALGERTLWLDCDVLQADGGTRTAAISGAYVAAYLALDRFGLSKALPDSVAGVSVGVVDDEALLDLDYSEDSRAEVDMNVVITGDGKLVEVQATAEQEPFSRERLDQLLELAAVGIERIAVAQEDAAGAAARA